MPATEQQFELISSLPGMQAAILAGVASEAARLRSGMLEWRQHGEYLHFGEDIVGVFCRNAASIIRGINSLEWMTEDASVANYL
ncbi:MAG: hypothetical protein ACN6PR_00025 [Achromobacter sp.]